MVRICVGINKAFSTEVCTLVGPKNLSSINNIKLKIQTPIVKQKQFYFVQLVTLKSILCCAGELICASDSTVRTR